MGEKTSSYTSETRITKRTEEMEGISGIKDMIEEMDTSSKENVKSKKNPGKIHEIWNTMKKPKPKNNRDFFKKEEKKKKNR